MKLQGFLPVAYLTFTCLLSALPAAAAELGLHGMALAVGGGDQPDTHDRNELYAAELAFYQHARSPRQQITVFVTAAKLYSSHAQNDALWAYSIVPQISFRLPATQKTNTQLHLLLRALGPSYISHNLLGERKQAQHFSFQAMVGAGVRFGPAYRYELNLAWRHYSNANLLKDNDGWDFPLTVQWVLHF